MSDIENSEKLKGVVKWFNDAKGFGFIEHTTGRDVFVHYSVILQEGFKTLEDGEEVEYEVKEGPKGLHAVKVSRPNFKIESTEAASPNGELSQNLGAEEGSSENMSKDLS
ncbi:MAG: cold shock domain-containing protein [Proteobacteria bacterium]|nr:cold shock domain-containing protein [Pseudomonadota bacterium]